MSALARLQAEHWSTLSEFVESPPLRRLAAGQVTRAHYASVLRQIFHHARENPQIQALATVYFRGRRRGLVRKFFAHATSEIGHDQLALNDLRALGVDVACIPRENPLPSTSALLGFAFYQIYNLDPIGYLGYLFFLEFTATHAGPTYIEALGRMGVPAEAMTFLQEHSQVDLGHNRLMEAYLEELQPSEAELASIVYAMRVTGRLYAAMIQGAFEQADKPRDWGLSAVESGAVPEPR